jgi:hypothetical protein
MTNPSNLDFGNCQKPSLDKNTHEVLGISKIPASCVSWKFSDFHLVSFAKQKELFGFVTGLCKNKRSISFRDLC